MSVGEGYPMSRHIKKVNKKHKIEIKKTIPRFAMRNICSEFDADWKIFIHKHRNDNAYRVT